MSKRQKRGTGKQQRAPRVPRTTAEQMSLESTLADVTRFAEKGQFQEAFDLIDSLSRRYPDLPIVHDTRGTVQVLMGNLWAGLADLERAFALSHDPFQLEPLARLYVQLEMNVHALHAIRRLASRPPQRHGESPVRPPFLPDTNAVVAHLESRIRKVADRLGIPVSQAEEGLRYLEDGIQALQQAEVETCINANRRAIKILRNWPPPLNNLSLALFVGGKPQEAVATARQVLDHDPTNIHALSNLCRFLVWTGQEDEARTFWAQLAKLNPVDLADRLKVAEGAALMEEDQTVYDLLEPVVKPHSGEDMASPVEGHAEFLLAVASANLGLPEARRRLEALRGQFRDVPALIEAVKAGRPGPGFLNRFPYFSVSEMMPGTSGQDLVELVHRRKQLGPKRFRDQMDRFLARFPQAVRVFEQWLWQEEEPTGPAIMLDAIGTPAAHAALLRYGLSQAGSDRARMDVLHRLRNAGQIKPGETVRAWVGGKWRNIGLHGYEVSDLPEPELDPQTADLMSRGEKALNAGKDRLAESLLLRALERDPQNVEALNNLGTIYASRGDPARATELFESALKIEPDCVHARCNRALQLLDQQDVDGAVEMLNPLYQRTHFRPPELAFFFFLQARIALEKEEEEAAIAVLKTAIQADPDFEPAEALLNRLERLFEIRQSMETFFEKRDQANLARRRRLQGRLSTPDPRLDKALPLYSADVLRSMGKQVAPDQRWSGLRKAALLTKLVATIQQPETLDWIVSDLNEGDRSALQWVLARGGWAPWAEFDARFGNDLKESAYWQWHEPKTTMGRLRQRGLCVESTVRGEVLVAIPLELRQALSSRLGDPSAGDMAD